MMRKVTLMLLLATAGCAGIDVVSPTPNAAPTMFLSLSIIHRDSTAYLLDGRLTRGTDASGDPLPLVDSAMVVEGERIRPDVDTRSRNFSYAWRHARESSSEDTLDVRLPAVAGVTGNLDVPVHVPAHAGPFERALPEGGDLELVLPAAPGNARAATSFWSARVTRPNGFTILTLSASGPGPERLEMAWPWLQSVAGDTLLVEFRRSGEVEQEAALQTRMLLMTQAYWRVVVVPPAAAAPRN